MKELSTTNDNAAAIKENLNAAGSHDALQAYRHGGTSADTSADKNPSSKLLPNIALEEGTSKCGPIKGVPDDIMYKCGPVKKPDAGSQSHDNSDGPIKKPEALDQSHEACVKAGPIKEKERFQKDDAPKDDIKKPMVKGETKDGGMKDDSPEITKLEVIKKGESKGNIDEVKPLVGGKGVDEVLPKLHLEDSLKKAS